MELYNDDCFNVFPSIEDKSVDLFVLDLPYANKKFGNCTACKWDTPIDLKEMWKHIKRIMKPNATIVHFCNTKFGFALIESNPKWFRYDLIWKKSRKVGFLSANKMPLRQHENIYIFNNDDYDENKEQEKYDKNIDLVNYSKKILNFIGITKKEIIKNIKGVDHFFRYSRGNFSLPIEENYIKLIEKYNIDKMAGFKTYEEMKDLEQKAEQSTYNPQKTEGKPYKTIGKGKCQLYNNKKRIDNENKGDRHPTSIIEMEPDHENIYVFKDKQGTYNPQKTEGKPYINNNCNETSGYYREKGNEYKPTARINKGDRHPTSIIDIEPDHENIYVFKDKQGTYNPQKIPIKPITMNRKVTSVGKEVYGEVYAPTQSIYKDRHPTSIIDNTILEYKNPMKNILHRTQKPVDLLEWLIKTYSNENDTVMDFCMGSGTAGVACKNLNRNFIGVEKDKEMFEKAKDRIEK